MRRAMSPIVRLSVCLFALQARRTVAARQLQLSVGRKQANKPGELAAFANGACALLFVSFPKAAVAKRETQACSSHLSPADRARGRSPASNEFDWLQNGDTFSSCLSQELGTVFAGTYEEEHSYLRPLLYTANGCA